MGEQQKRLKRNRTVLKKTTNKKKKKKKRVPHLHLHLLLIISQNDCHTCNHAHIEIQLPPLLPNTPPTPLLQKERVLYHLCLRFKKKNNRLFPLSMLWRLGLWKENKKEKKEDKGTWQPIYKSNGMRLGKRKSAA